jgi:hypothetical protein
MDKPVIIVLIAAFLLINGLLALSFFVTPQPSPQPGALYPEVQMAFVAIFSLLYIISAAGMFMLKKWGLSLARLIIAAYFIRSLTFGGSMVGVVIDGVLLWLLFTRTVALAFEK